MDEETKGWIELINARLDALEADDEDEAETERHEDNMRISIIIGVLCFLELVTAMWAVYETWRHA